MASTYSSNLNIEIISSGEQAGTWGDTTNQNWKRVEESRTYATIDIELPVAGSDTAAGWRDSTNTYNWRLSDTEDAYTSNSASSVGSGGRSSFVKFTGTPESDVTVIVQGNGATDYPNRVFFVKNGITGGDYKLLFDVGGTDFALQNGATAIIYCTPTGNEVGNVFDTFQVGGNAGGTTGLVLSAGSIKDVAGAVSFNDGNITNVGSIALDSIAADDGSSFAFSNNWTAAGRTCANLGTVTTSGAVTLGGALTVGSAASGYDVTFESATSGDNFLWDASAKKLVITGTDSTNALEVPEGNVSITDTLTATNIGAFNLTGKLTAAGNEIEGTNFDIDGGSIDGTNIGAGTKGTGAFTTLIALGDVDLGDATSDTITATGRFDSHLVPSSDNARDLGTSLFEWKDLYLDGTANIDSLVADTADIDGGSIDGVTIGTNTAVTELQVDNININANTISSTNTDGHVIIEPNGDGNVNLVSDTVVLGSDGENCFITTNGAGPLRLNTNNGNDTGYIRILDGVNRNINIEPNGSGDIRLFEGGGSGDLTLSDNDISGVGTITANSFVGNLTGNASGTAATAATVTAETQSAITTVANVITVGALNGSYIQPKHGCVNFHFICWQPNG